MKVILLADVARVGKKFDLVDVAPGYGRNFLFARGLGEAVTKSSAKRALEMQKKREDEKKVQDALLEKALSGVRGAVITLKRKASEEGSLYAGVTQEELALELGKMIKAPFLAEHIELPKPIKEVGEFTVAVLIAGKKAEFTVHIEATAEKK